MRAGLLRHRVTLERPREGAPDAHGAPPAGWEPVAQTWAEVVPLSGRELEVARQVDARTTHRVRLRYFPGVSSTWRVRLPKRRERADRYLNLVNVVNENERDRELLCMAQEVGA